MYIVLLLSNMMVVPADISYAYIMFEIGRYFIDPSEMVKPVSVTVQNLTAIESMDLELLGRSLDNFLPKLLPED